MQKKPIISLYDSRSNPEVSLENVQSDLSNSLFSYESSPIKIEEDDEIV